MFEPKENVEYILILSTREVLLETVTQQDQCMQKPDDIMKYLISALIEDRLSNILPNTISV